MRKCLQTSTNTFVFGERKEEGGQYYECFVLCWGYEMKTDETEKKNKRKKRIEVLYIMLLFGVGLVCWLAGIYNNYSRMGCNDDDEKALQNKCDSTRESEIVLSILCVEIKWRVEFYLFFCCCLRFILQTLEHACIHNIYVCSCVCVCMCALLCYTEYEQEYNF